MREQVKPAPLVTCLWARHSMPTCLIGKAGCGVHHGQKRKLHHRPNTLPQTTSPHSNFSLAIGRRTIHCPKGVPSRPTPLATGRDLSKGTRACLGGGVHTGTARSESLEGERASEGRGCSERGTLNADRKAHRIGAACTRQSDGTVRNAGVAQNTIAGAASGRGGVEREIEPHELFTAVPMLSPSPRCARCRQPSAGG